MSKYKISIIIPVYNVAEYLPACLDSLVNQTLQDIEIIAVNDGSPDNSLEILTDYQQRYPEKVKVFTTANMGVSHARNYGFQKSQGEFIWFVDSDDFVETNGAEKLYNKAISDNNDLVLFQYRTLDSQTGEASEVFTRIHSQNFRLLEKPYEMVRLSMYPWNKIFKRTLLQDVSFPEGMIYEDAPVVYYTAVKAASIGVVHETFYNYRKNIGSSSEISEKTFGVIKSQNIIRQHMKDLGVFEQLHTELDFITIRHFFYRFSNLFSDYEPDKAELKIQLINQLYDYIESLLPDWKSNPYIKYNLLDGIYRLLPLYGSREELLRFVKECSNQGQDFQDKWLSNYADQCDVSQFALMNQYYGTHSGPDYKNAQAIYAAKANDCKINSRQIFIESASGQRVNESVFALLCTLHREHPDYQLILSVRSSASITAMLNYYQLNSLTLTEPDSADYIRFIATSKYIISDTPLPSYYQKKDEQLYLLLCPFDYQMYRYPAADKTLYTRDFTQANYILFSHFYTSEGFLINSPYNEFSHEQLLLNQAPAFDLINKPERRSQIRQELHIDNRQVLFLLPAILPVSNIRFPIRAHRRLFSCLYQLDAELKEEQLLYIHVPYYPMEVDFSDFKHIRPMPEQYCACDFINACDMLITDYHSIALYTELNIPLVRFLYYPLPVKREMYFHYLFQDYSFCTCTDTAELLYAVNHPEQISPVLKKPGKLTDGKVHYDSKHICTDFLKENMRSYQASVNRVYQNTLLFYTDRRLSADALHLFERVCKDNPKKDCYFAFNPNSIPKDTPELSEAIHNASGHYIFTDTIKYAPDSLDDFKIETIKGLAYVPHKTKKRLAQQYNGTHRTIYDHIALLSVFNAGTYGHFMMLSKSFTYYMENFSDEKYQTSYKYRQRILFLYTLIKRKRHSAIYHCQKEEVIPFSLP